MVDSSSTRSSKNISTDQAALLSLKSQITSDPYGILEQSWSTSNPVCNWTGITCSSRHYRVSALDMSGMNLTGKLPTQLGNLSFLASLDLSRNNFHGDLVEELANLRRLKIMRLSYNSFGGQIPTWLGSLSSLGRLSLRNNSFSGSIPPSLYNLSNLEYLDLNTNSLEGEIPKGIENLGKLKRLILAYNKFEGSIPPGTFNISTLEQIIMTNNMLSGDLQVDMCHNLPNLELLALSKNGLTGQIPRTMSNCSKLQVLSLSYNKLTGVIPEGIGKLENLEFLALGGNSYSRGVIPNDIGNLPNLETLAMELAHLTGSIPQALLNISTLRFINLCGNDLEGEIPKEISRLHRLENLQLCINRLSGSLPPSLFNISTLKVIMLMENDLRGEIPKEMINAHNLEDIMLSNNSLSGSIPIGEFNLSSLKYLKIGANQLSGTLPSNMGYGLPKLEELSLYGNNLRGVIPSSLSNLTRLVFLQLQDNQFTGEIPHSLGDLRFLEVLNLARNNLNSQGLSFITPLTKCEYLRELTVSGNPLNGNLPASIGNLSALQSLRALNCGIKGSIPNEVGHLTNLILLSLSNNYLIGRVPSTMKTIQALYLDKNFIDGSTLHTLCELQNMYLLILSHNNISSPIPECLGKLTSLRYVSLSNNRFPFIPPTFWSLEHLIELSLSSNLLKGSLPQDLGNFKVATILDFSNNQLSGEIPNVFTNMPDLEYLHLNNNGFNGSIPDSLGKVVNLHDLDLSYNNLSGSIPKPLESLRYLQKFNVSFNNLSGEIPSSGPFKNFTNKSLLFNNALCGDSRFQIPPCPVSSTNKKNSRKKLVLALAIPLGITMCGALVGFFLFLLMRFKRSKKQSRRVSVSLSLKGVEKISYYELLEATDKFNEGNFLGSGSFGSVYKGILGNGTSFAVKVFSLHNEDAFKSFEVECEVLRLVRHRNLTKVITSCCTNDFKALVLQYMCNGSLEKWLYSHNHFLNFIQRLNIMVDIACALEYLHYGYSTTLVHCDLKPGNVLLDEDMVAHVSDFGIAKLFGEGQSISHTTTLATMGYIAPEYGLQGLVSTRSDVYSFGIMMMEVFTRKRPSDDMFSTDLSLKKWVGDATPHAVIQVVDADLIQQEEHHSAEKLKSLSSIMDLALCCSRDSPNDRINMKDVLVSLKKIQLEFLAHYEKN